MLFNISSDGVISILHSLSSSQQFIYVNTINNEIRSDERRWWVVMTKNENTIHSK